MTIRYPPNNLSLMKPPLNEWGFTSENPLILFDDQSQRCRAKKNQTRTVDKSQWENRIHESSHSLTLIDFWMDVSKIKNSCQ